MHFYKKKVLKCHKIQITAETAVIKIKMGDAARTEPSAERQLHEAENIRLSFQIQRPKFCLEKTIQGVKCIIIQMCFVCK